MATPVDLAAADVAIRARLIAIVEATPNVSTKVHDYWRNVAQESVRNALMKDDVTGALHSWFVSLAFNATLTQERDGSGDKGTLVYDLHGYFAVNDEKASEKVFAGKVLDVVTQLNGSQKLILDGSPLASPPIRDSGPVQLLEFNQVEFASVLCHHAQIQVPVVFNVGTC